MPPRIRTKYQDTIVPKLKEQFGISNPMAVPFLEKVVLNIGVGKQIEGTKLNVKAKEQVLKDLAVITGQKPVINKARKSVANFKLRAGFEVGATVTLRNDKMWEFVDRLISLAIPRIKDFRGLNDKSFDKSGNYSFGITEQGIFPEVNMADAQFLHGMHVTFVFSNSSPAKSLAALKELGVPFVRPEDQQRPSAKKAS